MRWYPERLPAEPTSTDSRVAHMARAFRHRNYRLFFLGQSVSLVGTWITRVAMSWLVYRLTGSAVLLGVAGFAGQIPTLLLAPLGGVLADRWDRQRVLVVTQAMALLQSALLAYFALSNTITVGHVIGLAALQGTINALDTPARQAFVVEMVQTRDDLPNAIALNSSMVNGARLLGPSIAGVLIAAVGEGWCFALDALTYLAVILSLVAMRVTRPARPARRGRVLVELRDGLAYIAGNVPIRAILLLLAVVSLMGMPYTVLMPIFAARVLGGGPHTLGLLTSASGVGALLGALWLSSRRGVLGLGRVICAGGAAFGAGLIGFGCSPTLGLSVPMLVLTGGGMMVQMAASNTLVQTVVDDDKRGRVMSFYTMAFFGMTPVGSLAAGVLGARFGAPATVAAGGVATLLAVLAFYRKLPQLRGLVRPSHAARDRAPAGVRDLNDAAELVPKE